MVVDEIIFDSTNLYSNNVSAEIFAGVALLAIFFIFLFLVGYYVYSALAYQSIYRKSGHKRPWMAWIPVVSAIPALQLGGFHWAWIFLALGAIIPFVGFFASIAFGVLVIISMWRIFKKAGYKGALSLLLIIPIVNLVILGIVAWQKPTYKKEIIKKSVKKKSAKKK